MSEGYTLNFNIPVYGTYEIVVIGGGPSGVAAAIAAARCGKRTVLIEQSAQLGGAATLANVSIFMPIGNCTGIFREIVSEIAAERLEKVESERYALQFDPFLLRYYLNNKLKKEKVEVLYHTAFIKVIKKNNRVTAVAANTREGIKVFEGRIFIDCTGDGQAAVDAGAGYTTGRAEDGMTQPMTLMFTMQNTGKPVRQVLPEGCSYYGDISELPQGRVLFWENNENGTLLVNMTRIKGNGAKIADINNAEQEALGQVFSVAHYLQRNGYGSYIISHIASRTGVRETNQIKGLYTLCEEDLTESRRFSDVVAQTNYEIDIHSPDGKKSCYERKLNSYDIPYRCMVPEGIEALLVAGRAVSATHAAMSSLRVQPTCYALGQAAGAAAAISIDNGCKLSEIPIERLHEILGRQGVVFAD